MHYTISSLRAVVDWIEVGFTTQQRTNLQAIRSLCDRGSAFSFDKETRRRLPKPTANAGTTRFSFRVQSPRNWREARRQIDHTIGAIETKFGLASTPEVVGIEVAIDIGVHGADEYQLAEIVADLLRGQTYVVGQNPRLYRDFKGSVEAIPTLPESLLRHLAVGYQIGIGDEDAPLYAHAYVKTTDNGGRDKLPQDKWRARYEVRIQGEAIKNRNLDYWAMFDFKSLSNPDFIEPNDPDKKGQRLFNFREIAPNLSPIMRMIAERAPNVCERRVRRYRGLDRGIKAYRKNSHLTLASPINKRIDGALRKLTARWLQKPAPPAATGESTPRDCGNFSNLDPKDRCKCWESGPKLTNYKRGIPSIENCSQLNTPSDSTTQQHIVSGDTTPDHTSRDHIISGQDKGGGGSVGVAVNETGKGEVAEGEAKEHKEMLNYRPSSSDLPTSPYTPGTTPPKGG